MSKVQVIGLPQSNYVWAVRIALAEKGVEHENVPSPPHTPPLEGHPLGKIPLLRHGGVTVAESRAIIDYVDRVFTGPPLSPQDPIAAAQADAWTSILTTAMEPLLIRQYLFAYMFPAGEGGAPDRGVIDGLLPKVADGLDVLERGLSEGSLAREPFGRTDAYLVPILFYMRRTPEAGEMLGLRPALTRYLDAHIQRASVQSTMPQLPT